MDNIQITTDCIKGVGHFGGTTYQNVCNGYVSYVPWGAVDMLAYLFLFGLLSTIVCFIGWGLIAIIRN
jgi:hypothetical protein